MIIIWTAPTLCWYLEIFYFFSPSKGPARAHTALEESAQDIDPVQDTFSCNCIPTTGLVLLHLPSCRGDHSPMTRMSLRAYQSMPKVWQIRWHRSNWIVSTHCDIWHFSAFKLSCDTNESTKRQRSEGFLLYQEAVHHGIAQVGLITTPTDYIQQEVTTHLKLGNANIYLGNLPNALQDSKYRFTYKKAYASPPRTYSSRIRRALRVKGTLLWPSAWRIRIERSSQRRLGLKELPEKVWVRKSPTI